MDELEQRINALEDQLSDRVRGPIVKESPVKPYRTIVQDSNDPGYVNRIFIGTATTGLVRVEWVAARYGQIIPPNWSMVNYKQFINSYMPLRYQVAAAQNLIVREFIRLEFEWLLFIEHDVILPPDAFKRFNDYMREAQVPVVSGLYYTRHRPSEPLIYRGRGTSFFSDWEFGDLVWCDGVPTGCLLIHRSILEKMWENAEEVIIKHSNGSQEVTRKVFHSPSDTWFDESKNQFNTTAGTSDLNWCREVIDGEYFEKAGWPEYQKMEYPFLVDTKIFCRHIDPDGTQFP